MMSSTSDKKSNFFFANCLQCEGIIRIPITIRPDSSVSCPHCSTQFDLYAYLEQIPEVSVSEGSLGSDSDSDSDEFQIETGDEVEKHDGKYIVPAQLAAGMRKRRRGRRRRRSSSEESNKQQSSASSVSTSHDPNRQLSEAEELKLARREDRAQREREKLSHQREAAALRDAARRQSRSASGSGKRRPTPKRSPIAETAKIIVGGLLAAPIAYLLLMWVFSRDPLALAPTLYQYAPIMVPARLEPNDNDSFIPDVETKEDPTDILSESEFEDDFQDIDEDIYKSDVEIP